MVARPIMRGGTFIRSLVHQNQNFVVTTKHAGGQWTPGETIVNLKKRSNLPLDLSVTAIVDAFRPRFIEGNAAIHFVLSPSHHIPFIEHNEYFKENVINGI